MQRSFFYNGRQHHVDESHNMFAIRTDGSLTAEDLFQLNGDLREIWKSIKKIDHLPQPSIWIYECECLTKHASRKFRERIKRTAKALEHPALMFIGTVFVSTTSGRYQLYTENLFLKLVDSAVSIEVVKFLKEHKLQKKKVLGFAKNAFFVEIDEIGRDVFSVANSLLDHHLVEYCHPELIVQKKAFPIEDNKNIDDYLDKDWVRELLNLDKVWEISKGKGATICIIDDGLEFEHEAFPEAKIIASRDMYSEVEGARPIHQFGTEGHGTACASIACSESLSSPGVAPLAKLIPIRINEIGSVLISEAIYWAVEQGADIISCSWGPEDGLVTENNEPIEHNLPDHIRLAIDYAVFEGRDGKGCLVFFAAGNGSEPIIYDGYAAYENVCAIGAINKNLNLTAYSDYGYEMFCTFPSSEIGFAADNLPYTLYGGLPVADRLGTAGYSIDDFYFLFGGTSAACPGVAGVAALVISINPELQRTEILDILRNSCEKIGGDEPYSETGISSRFGYGLLLPLKAVNNAMSTLSEYKNNSIMNTKKKYVSLHIGVNDYSLWHGDVSDLEGCVNDCNSIAKLANGIGYLQQEILIDEKATRDKIISELSKYHDSLKDGDVFLISYAGHGSQVVDEDGDEKDDSLDEVLVVYDGVITDDELHTIFGKYNPGVQIVMISDSCHSGTISRQINPSVLSRYLNNFSSVERARYVSPEIIRDKFDEVYKRKVKKSHRGIARNISDKGNTVIKATVILLHACKDNQVAIEVGTQGAFTKALLEQFGPSEEHTYSSLSKAILGSIETQQTPGLFIYGSNSESAGNRLALITDQQEKVSLPREESTEPIASRLLLAHSGEGRLETLPVKGASRSFKQSSNPWDLAYKKLEEHYQMAEYVEPDLRIPLDTSQKVENGSRGSRDEFLSTYPHPNMQGEVQKSDAFIWHLDDAHSQLKSANQLVFENFPLKSERKKKGPIVKIAHIDTGVLPESNNSGLPEYFNSANSRSFIGKDFFSDYTDYDRDTPFEQDGHGNATIAILAGGYVNRDDTDGIYEGYLGAFPWADVTTLRISESVVLLSGYYFAKALYYAVDVLKADVVTMSMAGAPSIRMVRATNYAYEKGVIVVSAAGNSWSKSLKKLAPKATLYPARLNRVISAVGATYNDQPYLVEYQSTSGFPSRAAGGKYMQTCCGGSDDILKTSLAAYTPNVSWSNKNDGSRIRRDGGGTSSATPQIAAAAGLYLQKHRKAIEALSKNAAWKKVEIVRRALFDSARKIDNYTHIFGNGILRAKDAIVHSPHAVNDEDKCPKDRLGIISLDETISLLLRRNKFPATTADRLKEMIATEVVQVILMDAELEAKLRPGYDLNNLTKTDLKHVSISPYASKFLQKIISKFLKVTNSKKSRAIGAPGYYLDGNIDESSGRKYYRSEEENWYEIESSKPIQVNEIQKEEVEEGIVVLKSFTIQEQASRSIESLPEYTIRHGGGEDLLALEEFELEGGEKAFRWHLSKSITSLKNRNTDDDRVAFNSDYGIEVIRDENSRSLNSRGLGKILRKVVVKLVKILVPGRKSRLNLVEFGNNGIEINEIEKPLSKKGKRLILLHGTFSSGTGSFGQLLENKAFRNKVQKTYPGGVLTFDMATVIKGVNDNYLDLRNKLKRFDINDYNVLAFSRGCLIGRLLMSDYQDSGAKMILVAGTNFGTPMADSKNLIQWANRVTTLASLTFGRINPIVATIGKVLKVAYQVILDQDGLLDQREGSARINIINQLPANRKVHITSIASNFQAKSAGVKQALDLAIDKVIFKLEPNDGVVPLDSAAGDSANGENIFDAVYVVPSDQEVHHLNFFKNEYVVNIIINKL